MTRISFTVTGPPRGKERARASARAYLDGDGKPQAIVSMHTPAETVGAEQAVLAAFRHACPGHRPWTGPVMVRFVAVFAMPKSWPKRLHDAMRRGTVLHTAKPDKDNIEKLIVDALTPPRAARGAAPVDPRGYAWVDDGQVQGGGMKRYGYPERIEVTLELIDQPDVPATPGQERAEARVTAGPAVAAEKALRPAPHKSEKRSRYPDKLRAAIDAALAKEGGR